MPRKQRFWLCAGAWLCCAAIGFTQEAGPAQPEFETLRDLIDASAKWYEIYPSADADSAAEPIVALRWANNSRGSEDGITILYVAAGRPIAAACIFPWDGRLEHDFESLARGPIVARKNGAVVWQPKAAGVEFAPIPVTDPPDARPAARLRQMKEIAKRFQATMLGWKVDNTDREELRMLPKPLYRYEPKEGPVIDGAVFAFAMGTDPEVLLLLEAVESDGRPSWQYAFARRTSGQLEGRLDGRMVWEAKRFPEQRDSRLPHFTIGTPLPRELVEPQATKSQP